MRRGIPVISDYTRNFFMDRVKHQERQIGDAVYYLSPFSRYSVRKSTIVKKGPVPTDFLKEIEIFLTAQCCHTTKPSTRRKWQSNTSLTTSDAVWLTIVQGFKRFYDK